MCNVPIHSVTPLLYRDWAPSKKSANLAVINSEPTVPVPGY